MVNSSVNQTEKELPEDVLFEKQFGQLAMFYRVMRQALQKSGSTVSIGELLQMPIDNELFRSRLLWLWQHGAPIGAAPRVFHLPFDPVQFFNNQNWKIAEQDVRSLVMFDFDAQALKFETCLKPGEGSITGEGKLKRLKKLGLIRLDAGFFMALWKEEGHKTLEWLHTAYGITWMEFLGTILRGPDGIRCSLYLYRDGDGSWNWGCYWLDVDRSARGLAAVLASAENLELKA
ncbi:MAG: hypothetical protein Q8P77_01635 [Candidatus Veblenbacteria bacterium]|nr:hypothetical protein [Candidatus Veblenbacteria bacterium]